MAPIAAGLPNWPPMESRNFPRVCPVGPEASRPKTRKGPLCRPFRGVSDGTRTRGRRGKQPAPTGTSEAYSALSADPSCSQLSPYLRSKFIPAVYPERAFVLALPIAARAACSGATYVVSLSLDACGHRREPMERRGGRGPRISGGEQERQAWVGPQRRGLEHEIEVAPSGCWKRWRPAAGRRTSRCDQTARNLR